MMNIMMVGFCLPGRDSSRGIGFLIPCLPVRPKCDTPSDAGIPEISTSKIRRQVLMYKIGVLNRFILLYIAV